MRALALFALLVALPAFAQSNEVKKYMRTAITLYENLEYEKALRQLKNAKLKARGPDDEGKIALLEGVVLADMGREDAALTAFKTGFSVDLEAKLPVEVSPKVQVIAEKARDNVRKVLAPELEAEKLAEEKRQAEQKAKEEEAARLAEQKRLEAEEKERQSQPPPAVVKEEPGPSLRGLSWIPGVVGVVSGGVAAGLFIDAGAKQTALLNGTADPSQAVSFRESGKTEATLGYVFTGVGVAGVAAAVVMFAVGAPAQAPAVTVVPVQGGGVAAATWQLDLAEVIR